MVAWQNFGPDPGPGLSEAIEGGMSDRCVFMKRPLFNGDNVISEDPTPEVE